MTDAQGKTTTWKVVNEAKDTTKDKAQDDAGNPIKSSHSGVSEADKDKSRHKEVEFIWAEKAFWRVYCRNQW